jgi:hypothetical protein
VVKGIFFRYATALVLASSIIPVEIHAQSLTASAATANAPKVGPKALYPRPSLTRGKADTLNASELSRSWPCPRSIHKPSCSYSQAHRDVPATVKKGVYAEYGVDPRSHTPGEIDHFYPLCASGSNDITNLWFQPETNLWKRRNYGFHEKDDLEVWICQQIKAGSLDARSAFDRLTTDWVKFYDDVKPGHQSEHVE